MSACPSVCLSLGMSVYLYGLGEGRAIGTHNYQYKTFFFMKGFPISSSCIGGQSNEVTN